MASLMDQIKHPLLFLSFLDPGYSRSGVYLSGLGNDKAKFFKINNSFLGMLSDLIKIRKNYGDSEEAAIVMSPCHKITMFAKLILKRRIILDAGWSLSESTNTHKSQIKDNFGVLRDWLIDFIAFHSASKVLLESEEQVSYVSRKFLVKSKKLHFIYTGVNEKEFSFSHSTRGELNNKERLQVLFRGKYNSESGLPEIAEATLLLEDEPIDFLIHTNSNLKELAFSSNTKIISRFIENSEMALLYENSDVCLGQFSNKARLNRTIPHKTFESLFFSKCYVTPRTDPLISLVSGTKSVYFTNGNLPEHIAEALKIINNDRSLTKTIGRNGKKMYNSTLTQKQLSQKFMDICCS